MRHVILLLLLALAQGCSFHTTATEWHGRVGVNGKPVHLTATSKLGFNLLIFVPFLGNLAIDGLVADITEEAKRLDGDNVRVIQADSENYWYGFPPFTWVLTPVISTVAADFEVPPGTPITEKG